MMVMMVVVIFTLLVFNIGDCDYYIKNICLTIYYLVMMTMVQIVETICWFMRWMEWDEIMAYFFGQSPLTHTIRS